MFVIMAVCLSTSLSVWSVCPSSSRSVRLAVCICLSFFPLIYLLYFYLSIYLTIPGQDAPQEGSERPGAAGTPGPLPQQADQPP